MGNYSYYQPAAPTEGAELDAVALNSLIDGLSGFNTSATYTHGQGLYVSGAMTGAPTSISLTNLPLYGTYMIVFFGRTTGAVTNDTMYLQLNGDTSSTHYVNQSLSGGSSGATGSWGTTPGLALSGIIPGASATTSYSASMIYFVTGFKTQAMELPSTVGMVGSFKTSSASMAGMAMCSYYAGSSSVNITSLKFSFSSGGGFANGSALSIYGLG